MISRVKSFQKTAGLVHLDFDLKNITLDAVNGNLELLESPLQKNTRLKCGVYPTREQLLTVSTHCKNINKDPSFIPPELREGMHLA